MHADSGVLTVSSCQFFSNAATSSAGNAYGGAVDCTHGDEVSGIISETLFAHNHVGTSLPHPGMQLCVSLELMRFI